jgi:uracil phosphoribosyltransferase
MSRNEETLKASVDYIGIPEVAGKTVILVDTMLATGGSALDGIEILKQYGPKRIVMICAIASQEGLANVFKRHPDVEIYPAAVDPLLNDKGYIVPGLGDAGDRSYGRKR